jgi:peroxiredoxin
MGNIRQFGVGVAALCCLSGPIFALNLGDTVDNFRLTDQNGQSHELYYLSDMKAVVLLAEGNGCAASRAAAKSLDALRARYQARGVEFLAIDSNSMDTPESIGKEVKTSGQGFPVLSDELQLIGESLGFSRNGEVLIVNSQTWKVLYRGAVAKGSQNYVADALDAALTAAPVKVAQSDAGGCNIVMPERDRGAAHAQISYEKTIAPMLSEHCVACHREGGIAPWQMSNYDMVRGFSPMIREVIRTKRMPPWHADPHYGVFSNDRSLTPSQTKMLVHWIEAGSPRGSGEDPLTKVKKDWPVWALGKPDLIVNLPKFDVPATGVIPYQMWTVDNPLDHDVWVRAVDFLPGARSNLHHIIATIGGEMVPGAKRDPGDGSLADYVPGSEPLQIPPESGILLKKGAKFGFQAHYTVNGKETTDTTQMGLYFMDKPPQYRYRAAIMANPKIKIPANTKIYTNDATHTFDQEVLVYSLHPHAHFRGSAAEFVAQYPDGREEVLLNVPRYEFNWQTTYVLKTPVVLPAGTKVKYIMSYDNSTQNKANPDPNREVPWGQQTWDEMLFGVIRYRYLSLDATPTQTAQATQ